MLSLGQIDRYSPHRCYYLSFFRASVFRTLSIFELMNHLYFGDSLDILKQLIARHPDGFIDLVYIDPPFNSKRNYNVLFETVDLHDARAQKEAFADTWSNVSYKDTLNELSRTDLDLYNFLNALDHVHISQSAVSYLTTMAIRIYYIHKVLKPTGSFYLHCDPTMSHYLKIVCDLIFGEKNYQNEIVWKRTSSHNSAKRWGPIHDNIFFYSKSDNFLWNRVVQPLDQNYLEQFYRYEDEKGRYRVGDLTASGIRTGQSGITWKGFDPAPRHWGQPNDRSLPPWFKFPSNWDSLSIQERFDQLDLQGLIHWPKKAGGMPAFKRYLLETSGAAIQDVIDDIQPLQFFDAERLGYPTQKPVALLERIIQASSNEGDVVADFFCGCGTTVAAAQKLNRKWIGVDISHLAIGLIRKRLIDTYGEEIVKTFTVDGLPKDIGSARALALAPQGRMHFQDWVIETLLGGVANEKKPGDGGYDGYTTLEVDKGKKEIILIEVKSGKIGVTNLRSFATTVDQQKASAGILVCFKEQITKGMLTEAKGRGYMREDIYGNRYDKIQIISVEELLDGKQPSLPRSTETGPFKKAEKAVKKNKDQGKLEL
jgi:DNA modification methylase